MQVLSAKWLAVSAVLLGLVFEGRALATPLNVPAGTDLFETRPGAPPNLGTWADVSLPPGFFGTVGIIPSDPFNGRVFFKGQPTGPLGNTPTNFQIPVPFDENALLAQHGILPYPLTTLPQVDTIVQRGGTTLADPGMAGDTAAVPIEIISLSLHSVNPITVTYGGGFPSFFDVFATLNPPQVQGQMVITRTTANGGTFDSVLPVRALITFTNQNPVGPSAIGPVQFDGTFQALDVPWIIVPEPSGVVLLGLGLGVLAAVRGIRARRRG